jgi:very-short-patch-repair endonuclease
MKLPPIKNIVIGQTVDAAKVNAAKQQRRTMTIAEKLLWQQVRANRLGGFHFRRQQIAAGYIVDFYCHAARLVVEVDGPIHEQQRDYDKVRDLALTKLGFRIVRFSNDVIIRDLQQVVTQILKLCQDEDT